VIVVFVLAVLAVVVTAAVTSGLPELVPDSGLGAALVANGPYGVLQSAGLLFFAFAGYARIATLGEEVREPARTIPRAIPLALGITVVVYGAVAVSVLGVLGAEGVAATPVPLSGAVEAVGWSVAEPVVRAGAAVASLGALLALIAGVGRTTLAMARERDLPGWLAAVHPRFSVPYRAEIAISIVVLALVATVDLRGAIGFSSFGVLLYYVIANAAAVSQSREQRRYPRAVAIFGIAGCLTLVATLPPMSIVVGLGVLAVGLGYRLVRLWAFAPKRDE
jgi:APA family basic amino acid/polyamine antiporter